MFFMNTYLSSPFFPPFLSGFSLCGVHWLRIGGLCRLFLAAGQLPPGDRKEEQGVFHFSPPRHHKKSEGPQPNSPHSSDHMERHRTRIHSVRLHQGLENYCIKDEGGLDREILSVDAPYCTVWFNRMTNIIFSIYLSYILMIQEHRMIAMGSHHD